MVAEADGTRQQTRAAGAVRRFAPAKLNLYLHVAGRRPDGYHELDSLVVFLDLGDTLLARPGAALSLAVEGPFASALISETATAADNLVLRAAHALAAAAAIEPRAALVLEKRIPVGAGLGGGSADAAAALAALSQLWGLDLGPAALDVIALRLGADVPVCRRGLPQNLAGIGEIMRPAPALPPLHLVVVYPGVALATARVFAELGPRRTPAAPLLHAPRDAVEFAAWLALRGNDLEEPAARLAPAVNEAKAALAERPACLLSRMSGSGSACFGLFADAAAASAAAAAIAAARRHWWVVACGLAHQSTDATRAIVNSYLRI
jgi:4-diphosphocytidyl-2-C-methyl-D-erythritol kinase